ncbi:glycosyltransferase family 2 protein [Sphingobacterium sp. SRCM116780]|uniref:glycosyltransferase family 2 protein n=1 Tax=Sphingobacterium sp. SRCM116780 TaxID=2907623 RepID=UPI001F1DAFF9|nr:glycosyltransferase family 2 protein [Sphingobacterium sp. SRCM116780]UIR56305.1 glycosyltransferase family 2 protein [Sphingobacterium sp. SRCM116780]
MNTTISLIISTYNWPEALALVLQSVTQQSRMPDEIIIADDGSDNKTRELIADFESEYNLPIKHIWHEDKGFRKCIILNKALQASIGSYIIEIDGDIIINKHFVADHLKAAQKGFFVQGSRAMIGEARSKKVLETKQYNLHALSNGMHTRFNAIRFPLLSGIFKTNPTSSHNVKGCNLAFWKEDYIHINGYFNGFEGWGWEDYEFAERMINSGIKKKRLKWAAIGFHIFHPLSCRANFAPNELIYRETVRERIIRRTPGYSEVQYG